MLSYYFPCCNILFFTAIHLHEIKSLSFAILKIIYNCNNFIQMYSSIFLKEFTRSFQSSTQKIKQKEFSKILKLFFLLLPFFSFPTNTFAQDSSHIRVSLLTCTPGDEVYSTFGHSALRIIDSSSVTDIVFNYGTFNFDDPGFYTKFIRGKLLYFVSTDRFEDFKSQYETTNRGITEQVLNFNAAEKLAIEQFLYHNLKEENKFYLYDFFLDNCTTRLRDIIVQHKTNYPPLKAVIPKGTRFRQAIHEYLDKNGKDWSKLAIDLLLGAPTDAVMTTEQTQFLPDILMKALDSSNQQNHLVISSKQVYPFIANNNKQPFFTPLLIFSFLLISIVLLSLSANKKAIAFINSFDGLLFFITGALGFLFVFMWAFSDHSMVKNNYNLIWAWPIHLIFSFFVSSKKQWVKNYFICTAIGLMIVLLSWFFLPQQMNNALIPILLILIYRSIRRVQSF